MRKKKIILNFNGKKKSLNVEIVPWWYEGIGLMFKKKNKANALLFSFENSTKMRIHSWFVFFSFYAIWCDKDFNVLEFRKINPFLSSVKPKYKFNYLIEVPISRKYRKILRSSVEENI